MDFSDFINSSPQPLLAIDCARGSVLAVNPAAEKLLGFTAPVITAAGDAVALFVTHYDRWTDLCRRLMGNRGRCSARMLLRNAAGKSFPALLEGVAFVGQGRQEGLLCIHADASDVSVPERPGRDEADAGEDPHYGLVTVREDGSIVSINRRGLRMLGYKRFRDLLEDASVLGRLYEGSNAALGMSGLAMDFGRGVERDLRRCDGRRLRVYETCRKLHGTEGPGLYELRWLDIDHYRLMAEEYALCQEKYRVLVEHSQDGVFITHEGLYVYVNSTYAHMLGRTVDEMIGRPFMEFIDPEDRPRMAMMWHEREAGRWEKNSYEIRLLHRNPEQRVLASVRSGPIYYKGKLSSTGTIRDITEERRTAEALQTIQRNYQEIFENLQIGIYQTTLDGRLLSANRAFASVLGYESVEKMLRDVADVTAFYTDKKQRDQVIAMLQEQGRIAGYECELRTADGRRVACVIYSRFVPGRDLRQPYIEGALVDVTERQQVEKALARSEAFYRSLVEHGHVGVFLVETGCFSYANTSFAHALGHEPGELVGRPVESVLAPDQRPFAEWLATCKGTTLAPGECRFVRRDGQSIVTMLLGGDLLTFENRTILVVTAQDISAQKAALAQLHHQSRHDPLTGLPNRTVFRESLAALMSEHRAGVRKNFAVLFLDLDAFKLVNDTFGHLVGDELLVRAARRLEFCLPAGNLLSRHGGDEFTVLLTDVSGPEDVESVVARFQESMKSPFFLGGQEVYTSTSIGIAIGGPDHVTPEDILRDADTAMYEAKKHGPGRHVFFDVGMRSRVAVRLKTETDLRHALANEKFEIVYQPIIELAGKRVIGLEALLRWRKDDGTCVTPGLFIDIAEELGLTLPLSQWFLARMADDLKAWSSACCLPASFYVSFNLSHRQFFDPSLAELVAETVSRHGLDCRYLCAEVTEKVVFDRPEVASRVLASLHEIGVRVALDDFGTGYSSFGYLRDLRIDALKLDRSFVTDLENNERTRMIVASLVRLARGLRMDIVAEGVETATQADLLSELCCPAVQGYCFSPPIALEQATALLRQGA